MSVLDGVRLEGDLLALPFGFRKAPRAGDQMSAYDMLRYPNGGYYGPARGPDDAALLKDARRVVEWQCGIMAAERQRASP